MTPPSSLPVLLPLPPLLSPPPPPPLLHSNSNTSSSGNEGRSGAPSSSRRGSSKQQQKQKRRGPKPQACSNCRRLKLKCDRSRPCRHCIRRTVECIYANEAATKAASSESEEEEEEEDDEDENLEEEEREQRYWRAREYGGQQQQPQEWAEGQSQASGLVTFGHDSLSAMPSSSSILAGSSLSPITTYKRPTAQYSRDVWFDHLVGFFGPHPQAGHRTVALLVDQSLSWASSNHWFELIYLPSLKRDIQRERTRSQVNPALAFALVAVALRERTAWQQGRRPYGIGPGHTLIADEALPAAQSPYDLSERIKDAAQAYLEQSIASMAHVDPSHEGGTVSVVQAAQAAVLLMLLETEVSPGCMYYLGLATSLIIRSPHVQSALDHEASITTGNRFQDSPMQRPSSEGNVARSSTQVEEIARLRLLPIWWGSRIGMAYFNVEIANSIYRPTDMDDAYVFGPWPEDPPRPPATPGGNDEYADSVRARILGLNVMTTNLQSRFLSYDIDYSQPTESLAKILKRVDDDEFIFGMLLEALDWEAENFFTFMVLRFCTSICHLHGMLIRRLGFAHSDALRSRICDRLRGGNTTEAAGNDESNNHITFQSPILSTWPDVLRRYMKEMDEDYEQAVVKHHHWQAQSGGQLHNTSSSSLQLTKFQLDVLKLYVAATIHLRRGIMEALKLAGRHEDDVEEEPLALKLKQAMDDLQMRIRRHQDAFAQGM